MTKVYAVLQWATGTIAATALLLSLVAAPAQHAWADEGTAGPLATICDATCSGSYPKCGTGACSTVGNCVNYKCKLILAGSYKACECNQN